MTHDPKHSKDHGDLDPTDQLPMLEGAPMDAEVKDDAVLMEPTAVLPGPTATALGDAARRDFVRPSAVDLPALAQSVRSVEERIARQVAEFEALSRLYEKSRDAEAAAAARAAALAGELATAQSALAVERHRADNMERSLADRTVAADAARAHREEALREAERHQSEARTLREALAARDATIVQVLHSLGERDAQLNALQREHAHTVPALEARSHASAQMQAELQAAQGRTEEMALELKSTQQGAAALARKLEQAGAELRDARRELGTVRSRADAYLETLQTRVWRQGFDQNLFLEKDAHSDAARAGHGMLQAERDRLKQTAAVLSGKLVEQDETIAKRMQEIAEARRVRTELDARLIALEGECKRWQAEVAAREQVIVHERSLGAAEVLKTKEATESQAMLQTRLAEQRARIVQLEEDAQTHEEEMTVLLAHLNEARKPAQSTPEDLRRLNEELAQKNASIGRLNEDNRELRATLERTRGALEEREFLIRRLERSESKHANALGRIQTTIEKLGAPVPSAAPPAPAAECTAVLTRTDGEGATHTLGRRTRVGRAPGCEMQIDAASVSRYHALIIKGQRELIIEDLNSTNGVLVNGRKISRYSLHDGDLLTIGEIQFRCSLRMPAPELTEAESAMLELTAPGKRTPGAASPGTAAPPSSVGAPAEPRKP